MLYFGSLRYLLVASPLLLGACQRSDSQQATKATQAPADTTRATAGAAAGPRYLSQPLSSSSYTADPSAHVFNGKIYIYPSHDLEAGIPENDKGDHFAMRDYHILLLASIGGKVTDHGVALDVKDSPWAGRQLWAPDATFKNGTCSLYFPVKDKQDVFRLGVATSSSPSGPFKAEPTPIPGSYSIGPAVFSATDGKAYVYFGASGAGSCSAGPPATTTPTRPRRSPTATGLPSGPAWPSLGCRKW